MQFEFFDSEFQTVISMLIGSVPQAMQKVLDRVAAETMLKWRSEVMASGAKPGHKRRYAESITINRIDGNTVSVSARGLYPNIVEFGIRNWRESFLIRKSGGPVRFSKKLGPYRIIPFVHTLATKNKSDVPEDVKAQLGSSKMMPLSISQAAKKIKHGESLKKGTNINGVDISSIEKKPGWKSGKYEGLTKTNRGGHTEHLTFRIVHGQSTGWRDIPAHPVFPGMRTSVLEIIRQTLDNLSKEI